MSLITSLKLPTVLLLGVAMCRTTVVSASVNECKLALGEMHHANDELEQASTSMWEAYDVVCKDTNICVDTGEQTLGSVALNFRELRGNDEYDLVKKACLALSTDEMPTTLCKVDTRMTLNEGRYPYTVRKEPVCFPFQCAEDQVALVDTNPMGCNPRSENCGIQSQTAYCDNRPAGAGTGNCKQYAERIAVDADYTQAKINVMRESQKHCEGITDENPGNNKICAYEKAAVDIVVAENFRPFEKDLTYRNYMDKCYAAHGQTCFLSMNVRLSGTVFYNLDVSGDYNDVPGCFPHTCTTNDRKAVMREAIGRGLATKITTSMNKIPGGKRKLYDVEVAIAEHASRRFLADNDQNEKCPMGMDECETTLVDFYCTGKDGVAVETHDSSAADVTAASLASSLAVAALSVGLLL